MCEDPETNVYILSRDYSLVTIRSARLGPNYCGGKVVSRARSRRTALPPGSTQSESRYRGCAFFPPSSPEPLDWQSAVATCAEAKLVNGHSVTLGHCFGMRTSPLACKISDPQIVETCGALLKYSFEGRCTQDQLPDSVHGFVARQRNSRLHGQLFVSGHALPDVLHNR